MALNSPGVQVQVIDESFYTPAGAGTTPMIFVATSRNKSNSSGTGTALGTLDSNIGKVYTITSQRDLSDTFGVPYFETDASSNPVHGGELNEYGLQAAYSALGVTSKVYIARTAVDLGQLVPSTSVPQGDPVTGTYWLDANDSRYGIGEWDAVNRVVINKTPIIIDDTTADTQLDGSTPKTPKSSIGSKSQYAVVVTKSNKNSFFYKNSDNNWVLLGSNKETHFGDSITGSTFTSTCWQTSWPVASVTPVTITPNEEFMINKQTIVISTSTVAGLAEYLNTQLPQHGVGAKVNNGKLELYSDATTAAGVVTVSSITTGTLVKLGFATNSTSTFNAVTLKVQPHTQNPNFAANGNPSGSVYVKTTAPNSGASWLVKFYNGVTQTWVSSLAPVYADTTFAIKSLDTSGGKLIPAGTVIVESNYDHGTGDSVSSPVEATFKLYKRTQTGITTISSVLTTSTIEASSFQISETVAGLSGYTNQSTISVSSGTVDSIVTAISASALTNITASFDPVSMVFTISHKLGGDFKLLDGTNTPLTIMGFTNKTANLYDAGMYDADGFKLRASKWKPLEYTASSNAPDVEPVDGTLWYTPTVGEIDIMYHNGTNWVGYKNQFPNTDSHGPIISATQPTVQVGGHNGAYELVDGDIWISTADADRYGQDIYVWSAYLSKWVLQDATDQTSPDGWLFADARWATSGSATMESSITELLSSNYLDPDAPDPELYPGGMRLWNLRRSGNNVKKYIKNYISLTANNGKNIRYNNENTSAYATSRWVTASPNQSTGAGSFGRHAQRGVVVKAMKSMIDTNQAIRDTDTLVFNLIATPGYPELIANMVGFNIDRGQTAFVIGDTPFRLKATGTELSNWATNQSFALDNGETGAVSYDEYMAMFYPSGYTNDNFGNAIVVPPSHMMIRTIITSDQKSYQWFAPAGIRRGGVDNATSVGYILNGEFQPTPLPQSIRDVMIQTAKINPIATLPGSGIVNFGNLTRAKAASSLDRINVARLVCYLRRQLDILARPFLFEPNDQTTRNEIKGAAESLLLELVGQRALYDFIVICDGSNNTSARIDRSELWMDIAVEPVKAVEFIYIPLRLKKTGSIAGL